MTLIFPHFVSAVGRNFKFPIDVYFSGFPQLKYTSNSALYQYLRNFSNDSHFSTSVLKILVEERSTAHRELWNANRVLQSFAVGDVVKAQIQVQSNISNGIVFKLSYRAKDPFQIVKVLQADSYLVQPYNQPTSAT